MKKSVFIILFWLITTRIVAQAPLGFNYQGIARQADGTPITEQIIGIRISITNGSQGVIEFQEEHFPETNAFGLFAVIVGQGNGNSTLNTLSWEGGNLWLQIELDPNNSGNYILMGSQQLMSVPYALYSQQSGGGLTEGYGVKINNGTISNVLPDLPITLTGSNNVQVTGTYPNFAIESTAPADLDIDPANELQSIIKVGNTITLSDGGGSFTDEVDDADNNATNEIQTLSLSTNSLDLTDGGTVDLSGYLDNTDSQNLSNVLTSGNSAGNSKIMDLANPTLAQDAATKSYVDAQDGILQTSITTNTTGISALKSELDATQIGSGLGADGSYTQDATTNYIKTASSLQNADKLLDTQIQTNTSNITTLTGRLDNTYAFQASFVIQESEAVSQKQVVLNENLDAFNQVALNEIIVGARGFYLIVVDAERTNVDMNLSNLKIRVESTDYTIYVSSSDLNVARTLMLSLVVGDKITLLVTTTNPQAFPLTGVIGGYKISD